MSSPPDPALLKAGVMGWPVDHSLSPVLQGFWLKEHRITGRYDRLAIPPDGLEHALKALKEQGFQGVNITIPHKQEAYHLMDHTSPIADRIQAVNTVVVGEDGRLFGDNTDGFGFTHALTSAMPSFDFTRAPALVLGAGGASRAILAALHDAGVPEIRLANRTRSRAEQVVSALDIPANILDWPVDPAALRDAGLVVNTTSLGLKGSPAQPLLEIAKALLETALVSDIVYTPLNTPFLRAAQARGCQTVDGLGMLMHQARPGFEAWFGVKPSVTPALRKALLTALEG